MLLLVEDHPVNREILTRQLEALGFVTDTAADAEEALRRFAAPGTASSSATCCCPDRRRLRADAAPARARAQPRPRAHAGRRAHRQRRPRRARALPRGRDGRPRRQARDAGDDGRHAPALAAARRLAAVLRPEVLDELTLGDERMRDGRRHPLPATLRDDLEDCGRRSRPATPRSSGAAPTRSRARAGWSARTPSPSGPRGWNRPAETSWRLTAELLRRLFPEQPAQIRTWPHPLHQGAACAWE